MIATGAKTVLLLAFVVTASIAHGAERETPASAPLTLVEALEEARAANPRIAVLQALLQKAKAGIDHAAALYYPWMDITTSVTNGLSGSYGALRSKGLAASPLKSLFGASLNLWWSWNFATPAQVAAAEAGAESSAQAIVVAQWHLGFEVATTFVECLRLTEVRAAAEALRKEREVRLAAVTKMTESGLRSQVEVELARADFSASQGEEEAVDYAVHECRLRLSTFLGRRASVALPEPTSIETPSFEPRSLETYLADAKEQRPDRRELVMELKKEEARLDAVAAGHFPEINVSASGGYALMKDEVADTFGAPPYYGVGVGVRLPLFEGFRTSAQADMHRSAMEAIERRVFELDLAVESEVHAAHARIRSSIIRLKLGEKAVPAADKALLLAREEYAAGLADALRLAEAERAFWVAKVGLAQARAERAISVFTLLHAIGEDLSLSDVMSP